MGDHTPHFGGTAALATRASEESDNTQLEEISESTTDDSEFEIPPAVLRGRRPTDSARHLRRLKMRDFLPYLDKPDEDDESAVLPVKLSQLDEKWIDLDVLRSWLRTCYQHHRGICQRLEDKKVPQSVKRPPPAWLIDVKHFCLVAALPGMEYFALSYVWGVSGANEPSSCTLQENLDALQRTGALRGNPTMMPRTILHATHLTQLLGMKYLWVDRLCIVQDDNTGAKQVQLDAMGDIYAGAEAVIVVANGEHADSGIDGIHGISGRRYLEEKRNALTRQDLLRDQSRGLWRASGTRGDGLSRKRYPPVGK